MKLLSTSLLPEAKTNLCWSGLAVGGFALLLWLAHLPGPAWGSLFIPPDELFAEPSTTAPPHSLVLDSRFNGYVFLIWVLGFVGILAGVLSGLFGNKKDRPTEDLADAREVEFRHKRRAQLLQAVDALLGIVIITELILMFLVVGTEKYGFLAGQYARPPAEIVWHFQVHFLTYLALAIPTSLRMIGGLFVGGVLGVSLGLLLSRFKRAKLWSFPWLALFAPLPPLLLSPVLTFVLPSERQGFVYLHFVDPNSIFVRAFAEPIAFLCRAFHLQPYAEMPLSAEDVKAEWRLILLVGWCIVWPVLQAVIEAASSTPSIENTVSVARLSGSGRFRAISSVLLPQLVPQVFAGMWLGTVIGFIVLCGVGESGTVALAVGTKPEGIQGIAELIHRILTQGSYVTLSYPVILFAMLYMLVVRITQWLLGVVLMRWKYRIRLSGLRSVSNTHSAQALEGRSDLDCFVSFKAKQLRALPQSRGPLPAREPSPPSLAVHIKGLHKTYNEPILNITNLEIKVGKHFSVIGPSGVGKSTLVRIIAGIESPDRDTTSVEVLGRFVWRRNKRLTGLENLGIAFVFQDYALFPTMTVYKNVEFPLRMQGLNREEYEQALHALLRIFGISERSNYYPHEISGGTQQRVALARALMSKAQLLILDEPLSAIDQPKKDELVDLLGAFRAKCNELGIPLTIISVSHDNKEVLRVSDHILYLDKSEAETQLGCPRALFFTPRTFRVAHFLGHPNIFRGMYSVQNDRCIVSLQSFVDHLSPTTERVLLGPLEFEVNPQQEFRDGQQLYVVIPKIWINVPNKRFDRTTLRAPVQVEGHVSQVEFSGSHVDFTLSEKHSQAELWAALQEDEFKAHIPQSPGSELSRQEVTLSIDDVVLLDS